MFDAAHKEVLDYIKDLNPSQDELLRFYAYMLVTAMVEFQSDEEGITFLKYGMEKEESEKVKKMMIYVLQACSAGVL